MPKRIVRAVSIDTAAGTARQGDEVELTADEVAAFDECNALVPEGFESFGAYHEANQDAYRGGRGDTDAAQRALALRQEAASGGIIDHEAEPGGNPFVERLRSDQPTIDETVEMAEGDPEKAAQLLEAENLVTGQAPRKGVVEGLEKITSGGGE